jgi:aspartyl-tRNA synthetase
MHPYRTHTCGVLRRKHVGSTIRLSGWLHRKRDHGGVLFIDLRDHSGITQIVCMPEKSFYAQAAALSRESVLTVTGVVIERAVDNRNSEVPTGDIEIDPLKIEVHSPAVALPFEIAGDPLVTENLRLQHRFLDLRRPLMQERLRLRARVASHLRGRLEQMGFCEVQTPILTAASPEGARDFLVPSRLYPGQFYALPQAPQQFKQLLMAGGVDRYFQIAPCFRDEDARADRSPGEFYQLDLEMAFVEQEDIFAVLEDLLVDLFERFGTEAVAASPFPRLSYAEAMRRYGTDKPDLRFALEIEDIGDFFASSTLRLLRQTVAEGGVVRLLKVPGLAGRPRRFFDDLEIFVKGAGGRGLAYLLVDEQGVRGPIAAALKAEMPGLLQRTGASAGDALFFLAGDEAPTAALAGRLRLHLADQLHLRRSGFHFCWIVDFPLYIWDEDKGMPQFFHNPFSMPQGGLQALTQQDPLEVLAYQYDIVCNGTELSSGAIRNHQPEVMYRAFEIAGYSRSQVEARFGGILRAFSCGAPPHGGIAPGLDRLVMLLAGTANIREVTAFPMSPTGRDLLMNAPGAASEAQLRELGLALRTPV